MFLNHRRKRFLYQFSNVFPVVNIGIWGKSVQNPQNENNNQDTSQYAKPYLDILITSLSARRCPQSQILFQPLLFLGARIPMSSLKKFQPIRSSNSFIIQIYNYTLQGMLREFYFYQMFPRQKLWSSQICISKKRVVHSFIVFQSIYTNIN